MTEGTKNSRWRASEYLALGGLVIAVLSFVFGDLIDASPDEADSVVVSTTVVPMPDSSVPPVAEDTAASGSTTTPPTSTTEPSPTGSAGPGVGTSLPPRISVKITSALSSETIEIGDTKSLAKVYSAAPRGHDGRVRVTTIDNSVCTVSSGRLNFVGPGKCTVSVALPQTDRYNASSKKFSVTVLEKGLTNDQLEQLSGFAFNDANNAVKGLDSYISYGRFLRNLSLGVKDLRKNWRLKGSIQMPNLAGVECLSMHVRYSYQGQFSFTGDTQATTATSCAGKTGSFEFCREFNPSRGRSTFPALPADDSQSVTYDWINWGLVWKSTPVDHPGAAASPPSVRVTDVRPGSCS
jgi:hypothetical protein